MDAIRRRTFLAGAGALAASGMTAQAQHNVPNSSGSEAPKLKAPANACDCHMHIYDGERFPPARPGPQSRMQSDRGGRANIACCNSATAQHAP